MKGLRMGPNVKVALPASTGHVVVLIWVTFPAEPWPQVPPHYSLPKVYKPGLNYGLLCFTTCRRSFVLNSFALLQSALPAQCMGRSPDSSQLMVWGFNTKRCFPCNLTGQWGWRRVKNWSPSTEKWLLSRLLSRYCLRSIWQGLSEGKEHLYAGAVTALPCLTPPWGKSGY